MKEFSIYLLQTSACLAIFLVIYLLALRGKTFFQFNRLFLLGGMILSFIIPLIKFSYDVVITIPAVITATETIEIENTFTKENISSWFLLLTIYIIGILFVLSKNMVAYIRLKKIKKDGKCIFHDNFMLINSKLVNTPFSVFNRIYINIERLQEKEKNIIIKHEINHITQKHWIDLLCCECALTLQWFNPLMWYYIHLVKENHEYLADQAVLEDGESIAVYKAVLINQRLQGPVFSFANSFYYSKHQTRLTMMKKTKTSPWKKSATLLVLPFIGAFMMLNAEPNYVSSNKQNNTLDSSKIEVTGTPKGISLSNGSSISNPLYIVDGKEVANIDDLNPHDIESIAVVKDKSAIEIYGDKGKDGVIIIETKEYAKKTIAKKELYSEISKNDPENPPLLVIDNKEYPYTKLNELNTDEIEHMSVLKNKSAIELYGEKGKNGVIIIKTKKTDK